jgi:hypothetical protein
MDSPRGAQGSDLPDGKAAVTAAEADDVVSPSTCLLRIHGSTATLWGAHDTISLTVPGPETRLCLQPGASIVVGRQQGGALDYLDPDFRPTNIEPTGGCPVLRGNQHDICVSRGHFTLRGSSRGIVLVNGVPRRGGGIRPPVNGTRLVQPVHRSMEPAEEFLIEPGSSAALVLPNGAEILLQAE